MRETMESADAPTTDACSSDRVSAPLTLPQGHEKWKRRSFTEGLIEAYHRLGGIDYLVWFGRECPADFVRACSRMIPQEIRADVHAEVVITLNLPRTALDVYPEDELDPSRRNTVFQLVPGNSKEEPK